MGNKKLVTRERIFWTENLAGIFEYYLVLLLFVMVHEVVLCKGINSAKHVGSCPAIKSLTIKMAGNLTQ